MTIPARMVANGTAFLLVTALASMAEAQELASSFDQLRVLVKPGDTVHVIDGTGRETTGTIVALSSSSLELSVAGNRRNFGESETRTIRQRRSDSLKNGSLWGLGIGAGLGLLSFVPTQDYPAASAGDGVAATLIMGGLGTAVGVSVDAMIRHNEVIYSRPAGASARLTLSPLLARDRRGVLVSLGF